VSVLVEQELEAEQAKDPALLAQAVPSGWLPLLVRAEDYVPVTTFIASREARRHGERLEGTHSPRGSAAEDAVGVFGPAEHDPELKVATWPIDQLQQLANSTYLTAQRWTQAIDVVSPHPGRLLSSEQVAAMADMPINDWRDAARKLPQHLKAHYSVPDWPLYAVRGRLLGLDDQVYWGISTEQAALWRQVREGDAGGDA
jgi:hypothetical protein